VEPWSLRFLSFLATKRAASSQPARAARQQSHGASSTRHHSSGALGQRYADTLRQPLPPFYKSLSTRPPLLPR
jgi:hypothetical protein